MVAVVEFGEADEFAAERFTDEEQAAFPLDLASATHPPHLVVGVVPGVFEALRRGARRGQANEVGLDPQV
ncbi:MAG: hypothetical protein ABR878_07790 [Roseiarcus sp.]|jgi:hypothetical protein